MADLQGLPGTGTAAADGGVDLWQIDGVYYAVYFLPGTNVPMLYRFERDDLATAAAGDSPTPDRTLTREQANKLGAVEWGVTTELDTQLGRHPWDSLMAKVERDLPIAPWLDDPEVLAHVGAAWLTGEAPNLERTEWWQSKTDAERQWIRRSASNPTQARQELEDRRAAVGELLREAGVSNATSQITNYIADQWTRGLWSEATARQQIKALSDPAAGIPLDMGLRRAAATMGEGQDRQIVESGDRAALEDRIFSMLTSRLGRGNEGAGRDGSWEDPRARVQRLADLVERAADPVAELQRIRQSLDTTARMLGTANVGGLTQTNEAEDEVREMVARWLGPSHGGWSDAEIRAWAGRLRNDPNARVDLEQELKGLRLAAFPGWTNENTTYEQIASIARGLFREVWGESPDEHDPFFLKIAGMPDHAEAAVELRREGFDRGVTPVVQEAMRGILAATGGQVIRPMQVR